MTHETKTVRVDLGDRAYDILIGPGLIARAGREIAARLKGKRMAMVTDEHVASYLPALTASLEAEGITAYPLTLPAGEKTKSFEPLMQTLTALVKNAFDASQDGALVDVSVHDQGGQLLIEVLDRGVGMDSDTLSKAGEPFFTTKEPGRGMGLGLFLARTYAESLGGKLEVDSALGRGTKATLALPLARAAA